MPLTNNASTEMDLCMNPDDLPGAVPSMEEEKHVPVNTRAKWIIPHSNQLPLSEIFHYVLRLKHAYTQQHGEIPSVLTRILAIINSDEELPVEVRLKKLISIAKNALKGNAGCLSFFPFYKAPVLRKDMQELCSFLLSFEGNEKHVIDDSLEPCKEDGLLNTRFQYVDSLSISAPRHETIGVSKSKRGSFIFSDSFAICQAVLVRLKSGEFCVYHASASNECPGADRFVKLLKREKIKDIYVIQKSESASRANLLKAPVLSAYLAKRLGMEVKRIDIPDHTGIVCDAETNRVYLTNKIIFGQERNGLKAFALPESVPVKIDIQNAIPLATSLKEVKFINEQDQSFFSNYNNADPMPELPLYINANLR